MIVYLGDYPVVLLLVFFRVASVLVLLPFFGIASESRWLLAGVSFPITLVYCSMLPASWISRAALIETPGDIVLALMGEILLGGAIGLICGIFIAAFIVAGTIAGRGTSLSMAEELDPVSGESSGVISQIWRMLFLVLVLALDAHLLIFRSLGRTFETLPVPWTGWMDCGVDLALLCTVAFRTGLSIALPIMVISLLVSICMGLIARMASEFNVMFLSLPFRLFSGLFVLSLSILMSGSVMRGVAYDMLLTVERFIDWQL